MSKEVLYKILINCESESRPQKKYAYSFGSVKDISIQLSKGKAVILFSMKVEKSLDELLNSRFNILRDSLRKAKLLHLLLYSKDLEFARLDFETERDGVILENAMIPTDIVFSMIDSKTILNGPKLKLSEKAISRLLAHTKSKNDGRISAVYAYLYSRAVVTETEKLMYLWMGMNGIYGYCYSSSENYRKNHGECDEIVKLMKRIDAGTTYVIRAHKEDIARKVEARLKYWDGEPITRDSLETGVHSTLGNSIERVLMDHPKNYDISAYGYLLLQQTYYYRCLYLHANGPMLLLCDKGDARLRSLQAVNQIMADYIANNISEFLEEGE